MLWLDLLMKRLGEPTSTDELRKAGIPKTVLEILVTYGSLQRVRRGYYALPGHPEAVLTAWAIGGRLACTSALAHRDECEVPQKVHVLIPRHLSRGRLEAVGRLPDVVLHWSRLKQGGDGEAVSVAAARRHQQRCTNL